MATCETGKLVLRQGGEVGRSIPLPESEPVLIGRNAECELVIPDRRVSKHHARVHRHENHYLIEDLGSKNGTFINGKRLIEPVILSDGDEIIIAFCIKIAFQFEQICVKLN